MALLLSLCGCVVRRSITAKQHGMCRQHCGLAIEAHVGVLKQRSVTEWATAYGKSATWNQVCNNVTWWMSQKAGKSAMIDLIHNKFHKNVGVILHTQQPSNELAFRWTHHYLIPKLRTFAQSWAWFTCVTEKFYSVPTWCIVSPNDMFKDWADFDPALS